MEMEKIFGCFLRGDPNIYTMYMILWRTDVYLGEKSVLL